MQPPAGARAHYSAPLPGGGSVPTCTAPHRTLGPDGLPSGFLPSVPKSPPPPPAFFQPRIRSSWPASKRLGLGLASQPPGPVTSPITCWPAPGLPRAGAASRRGPGLQQDFPDARLRRLHGRGRTPPPARPRPAGEVTAKTVMQSGAARHSPALLSKRSGIPEPPPRHSLPQALGNRPGQDGKELGGGGCCLYQDAAIQYPCPAPRVHPGAPQHQKPHLDSEQPGCL